MAEMWKIPIQAYEARYADWKSHWHHCIGEREIISKVMMYFLMENKDFAFFQFFL